MELDMTSGKPLNTLLKFSLPLLAGSVIQNLYNIFDTAIVGHVLGHSSEATTRDVYTHLRGNKRQEQEEAINRIWIS